MTRFRSYTSLEWRPGYMNRFFPPSFPNGVPINSAAACRSRTRPQAISACRLRRPNAATHSGTCSSVSIRPYFVSVSWQHTDTAAPYLNSLSSRLIDAAHIVPDDEELGQPDVRNGICMSKLHHAAYDAGLIGIDRDFIVHVSERLLAIHDGPLLEQGLKALAGQKVRVPADALAVPDRDRLSFRFELFRSIA